MNTSRKPPAPKVKRSQQLCPSLKRREGQTCIGEKCIFEHDVDRFWSKKPADLGAQCHLYDVRGFCPDTFACRFACAHTSTGGEELKQSEFTPGVEYKSAANRLKPELQQVLRKKKYDFAIADDNVSATRALTADMEHMATKGDILQFCQNRLGPLVDEQRKVLDFRGKMYLAPLTTVGNLPFRRICVNYGAEVTCSEMTVATALLQGSRSEWSLVRRHDTELHYGVQLCGAHPDTMARAAQLLAENTHVDFIDINCGCPIDLICNKGAGCSLMNRHRRLFDIAASVGNTLRQCSSADNNVRLSVKLRSGCTDGKDTAADIVHMLTHAPVGLFTVHGRSREQRYTKSANWQLVQECRRRAGGIPIFGCGDVFSYGDYFEHVHTDSAHCDGVMIARGALIKPWIFTEIRERRHWDISASERLDLLKTYVNYGLEQWGSDAQGVENTRKFLLEWLSFLHRYIPVGLLEVLPQRLNEKPPAYFGRNELETLFASDRANDWVKISEMLLGKVPAGFSFTPKHKANSY